MAMRAIVVAMSCAACVAPGLRLVIAPASSPVAVVVAMVGAGPAFEAEADAAERAIRQVEPFRSWGKDLSMPRVEADVPVRDPDGPGRLLDVDEPTLRRALAGGRPDATIVLAHGETGGGGGGGVAVVGTADRAFPASAVHELGHALAGRPDEPVLHVRCIMRRPADGRFCEDCLREILAATGR